MSSDAAATIRSRVARPLAVFGTAITVADPSRGRTNESSHSL